MRPLSDQLNDLLSGETRWEDAEPSIRSWARLGIHRGALSALRMETKEERRTFLDKMPETIRPHMEAEIMRLWKMR